MKETRTARIRVDSITVREICAKIMPGYKLVKKFVRKSLRQNSSYRMQCVSSEVRGLKDLPIILTLTHNFHIRK
jgi:hypothetical protein